MYVLRPFKAWQVQGIRADGRIFTKPLGCLTCLYSWCKSHAHYKLRVPLHVSVWHTSWHPGGSPYLLKYWRQTKLASSQKIIQHSIILRMRAHFMLWEQVIKPSLKATRTLLTRLLQGNGNTASLSYSDTWVRKPDCLHLPYNMECSLKHILGLTPRVSDWTGLQGAMICISNNSQEVWMLMS